MSWLVNNMSDAALSDPESFNSRGAHGCGGVPWDVRLQSLSLDSIPRSEKRARAAGFYDWGLPHSSGRDIDALIVRRPARARPIAPGALWADLTEMIDGQDRHHLNAFSSRGAGRGVASDGIAHRPPPTAADCPGVYDRRQAQDDPLFSMSRPVPVRIRAAAILPKKRSGGKRLCGGVVSTTRTTASVKVDLFTREPHGYKPVSFLQGHPEYDPLNGA